MQYSPVPKPPAIQTNTGMRDRGRSRRMRVSRLAVGGRSGAGWRTGGDCVAEGNDWMVLAASLRTGALRAGANASGCPMAKTCSQLLHRMVLPSKVSGNSKVFEHLGQVT